MKNARFAFFICPVLCLLLLSCSAKGPVAFPVEGPDGTVLIGFSKKSVAGNIPLGQSKTFDYAFENPVRVPKNSSLELEYAVSRSTPQTAGGSGVEAEAPQLSVILHIEGDRDWEIPLDASLITDKQAQSICYAVPVRAQTIGKIGIVVAKNGGKTDALDIKALRIRKRWFGFGWDNAKFSATPFVARENVLSGKESYIINPPAEYRVDGVELTASALGETEAAVGGEDTIIAEPGGVFFEWTSPCNSGNAFFLPPAMLPAKPFPLRIGFSSAMGAVRLEASPSRPFPTPIPADPGILMAYPEGDWRDTRYEVFQWSGFPSILIFDTQNYAVQDKLFKRLAFFVEKAGYRGRISADTELEGKHAWNAHDYRAEDLAAFFAAAETIRFPLLQEEKEVEGILLAAGIIVKSGGKIAAGEGAIISISRESSDTLRRQFMAHEGFHGLFFIDKDFRAFSKDRFDHLSPVAKRFILSFFDYQHYDIEDSYLMVNEFQAHVLQQNVSQAAWYFGGNLAARLEGSSWRKSILPGKDEASATWPEIAAAFQTEANAFSAYARDRWGLAAGRVWRVTVR